MRCPVELGAKGVAGIAVVADEVVFALCTHVIDAEPRALRNALPGRHAKVEIVIAQRRIVERLVAVLVECGALAVVSRVARRDESQQRGTRKLVLADDAEVVILVVVRRHDLDVFVVPQLALDLEPDAQALPALAPGELGPVARVVETIRDVCTGDVARPAVIGIVVRDVGLAERERRVDLSSPSVLFIAKLAAEACLMTILVGVLELLVLVELRAQPVADEESLVLERVDLVLGGKAYGHERTALHLGFDQRLVRVRNVDVGFARCPESVAVNAEADAGPDVEIGELARLLNLRRALDEFLLLFVALAIDAANGYACILRQRRVGLLVSNEAEPRQRLFRIAKLVGVEPEVVLGRDSKLRRVESLQQRLARAKVLPRLVVRNTRVVVQRRRVHSGIRRLLVAEQCAPVQIVTEKAIAVGKGFVGRHCLERQGQGQAGGKNQCDLKASRHGPCARLM